jgi:hypothetical protein
MRGAAGNRRQAELAVDEQGEDRLPTHRLDGAASSKILQACCQAWRSNRGSIPSLADERRCDPPVPAVLVAPRRTPCAAALFSERLCDLNRVI